MDDLRDELAGLVADVAATLDAMRLQGTITLPKGEGFVSAPEPAAPPTRRSPPPASSPPPRREASAPEPARTIMPAVHAPPPATRAAPAPIVGPAPPIVSGGLLGGWGARLVGPEDRLSKVVASIPDPCPSCGQAPLTGVGGVKSGLVLLTPACTPEEAAVLSNMLLRVVGVEPADVWTAPTRACPDCIATIHRQIDAIKPRVALVLGAADGHLGLRHGEWGSVSGIPALATFHPAEMAADATLKRPAFAALQDVAKRR